ncbi:flagellar hook-associated protein FlgK [Timonella sp. A28]|uniref:flagellar hook-associated protein FlgK n=1 Tax=Timonella sp. A28 TaxID=3442640 RepID=UPI003EBECD2E
MSSFSGISTALSSLQAQRIALEVSGQNIANANTVGYTRQRANIQSIPGVESPTFQRPGFGAEITGIERLGNIFLDARVRATGSSSSFLAARADAYARIESTMNEPSDTGLSSTLNELWSGFQEVAKAPQTLATKQVVLERAQSVAHAIGAGYTALETQWSQHRTEIEDRVSEVNSAAQAVADLNGQIQLMQVTGSNANELIDQRQTLIQRLSELTGATARFHENGTADVSVGGNLLVTGKTAQKMAVDGAPSFSSVMETGAQLRVIWDRATPTPVSFDGGEISGILTATAPEAEGGLLATTAAGYNAIATDLATQVNDLLITADGGTPLFQITGDPAAKRLDVIITDPAQLKVGAVGMGEHDGTIADKIAQLAIAEDGPTAQWKTLAVSVGVAAKAAESSFAVAYNAYETASGLQLSSASVDIDEETVNMLAFQRGYQAASRVLTTVDEMLDQLINRTGVVGR